MINVGNLDVTAISAGTNTINEVYVGSTLIWPTTWVNVDPPARALASSTTSTTFDVTSNANWTASLTGSPTWAAITSGNTGTGNSTIGITLQNNFNSISERNSALLVEAGLISDSGTFSQPGVILDTLTEYASRDTPLAGDFPSSSGEYYLMGTTLEITYEDKYGNETLTPSNGLVAFTNVIRISELTDKTVGYAGRINSVTANDGVTDQYYSIELIDTSSTPGFDPQAPTQRYIGTYAVS